MKTKHTSGEWDLHPLTNMVIENGYIPICMIDDENAIQICRVNTNLNEPITREEAIANAKLIVAAPEMLFELASTTEDLKRIASDIGKGHPLWGMIQGIIFKNEELIKKATEL